MTKLSLTIEEEEEIRNFSHQNNYLSNRDLSRKLGISLFKIYNFRRANNLLFTPDDYRKNLSWLKRMTVYWKSEYEEYKKCKSEIPNLIIHKKGLNEDIENLRKNITHLDGIFNGKISDERKKLALELITEEGKQDHYKEEEESSEQIHSELEKLWEKNPDLASFLVYLSEEIDNLCGSQIPLQFRRSLKQYKNKNNKIIDYNSLWDAFHLFQLIKQYRQKFPREFANFGYDALNAVLTGEKSSYIREESW